MQEFGDQRVLISGGAGFIGSNLARRLVAAHAKVTLVDSLIPQYGGNLFNILDLREQLTFNIADVRDPFAIAALVKDQDYLFNLAGQTSHQDSMSDPHTDLDINAKAQLAILEACRAHNPRIKIVFASTRQLYGKPDYLPVDEQHPIRPVDFNGIHKFAGEHYHLLFHKVYGVRSCVLRLTNTYGPGMRVKDARQTFLGTWIRSLIDGKPLLVFGDGIQRRDLNYVDDVVDAMCRCALTDACYGQPLNLGSEEVVSLARLGELLVAAHGSGSAELVPFPPERRAIDIGDYWGDFRRFTALTGWRPKTLLAEGLPRTLAYYAAHRAHYWEP